MNNCFTTQSELEKLGFQIKNEMITHIEINVIGHFGNAVTLEVFTKDRCFLSGLSFTKHIGYVIQRLVILLDQEKEDGVWLSSLKNIPCRIVVDKNNQLIGIGHFMKDLFWTEDGVCEFCKDMF